MKKQRKKNSFNQVVEKVHWNRQIENSVHRSAGSVKPKLQSLSMIDFGETILKKNGPSSRVVKTRGNYNKKKTR